MRAVPEGEVTRSNGRIFSPGKMMISICHKYKFERSLHNNYTVMGHISICPVL